MTQLVLMRGLQGLGGGGLMVISMAAVADVIPPANRGRYQGLFGGVFGLATVIGPHPSRHSPGRSGCGSGRGHRQC